MKKIMISFFALALFLSFVVGPSANAIGEQTLFLFRLFNPRNGDHFYTNSQSERTAAVNSGYRDEGVLGTVFSVADGQTALLLRLFNSRTGDHFYTTSSAEADRAVSVNGYRSEGNVGFVFTTQVGDSVPMFRLFNSRTGDHFYTTSILERLKATESRGYVFEGVTGYVKDRLFNLIRVGNIQPNQDIVSPTTVTGEARGTWYFEASFPIVLLDENGRNLANALGQAQGDWMTENFVPFVSTPLTFQVATNTDQGVIVLEKDNPSGLSQNDDQLILPVGL